MRGAEADAARLQTTIARGALKMGTEPAEFSASLGICSSFYTLGFGFRSPAVVVLHRGEWKGGKRRGIRVAVLFGAPLRGSCLLRTCRTSAPNLEGERNHALATTDEWLKGDGGALWCGGKEKSEQWKRDELEASVLATCCICTQAQSSNAQHAKDSAILLGGFFSSHSKLRSFFASSSHLPRRPQVCARRCSAPVVFSSIVMLLSLFK